MNYAESDDDDVEDGGFKSTKQTKTRGRALKRRKTSDIADEEDFIDDEKDEAEAVDESKSLLSSP